MISHQRHSGMTEISDVNLTNCDREPIHIPGSIQPHGCLLACDTSAVKVHRHSANVLAMLGTAAEPNGRPLEDVIGDEAAHAIRNALARTQDAGRPAFLFGVALPTGARFDIAVHRFKGSAIIELEPGVANVAEPMELARTVIGHVRKSDGERDLFRDAARLLRGMLGYDRVMIYQLGPDGAGKVMAESKRGDLESFLGQYFPASDIPNQARALYLRNPIRIISDADDVARIAIRPVLDPSGEPLDLSFSHLRSVSPVHCEYLRNMGVGASMSISIIVDGELWGLVACHHYSPRTLTMAQRLAAEMFGEFFSLHIQTVQQARTLKTAARARAALDRFLREATRSNAIDELLRSHLDDFAALVPCDGVGLYLQGKWVTEGVTPPAAALPGLARFAEGVADGRIWATGGLSGAIASAESYAAAVSGVLIVPLSQRPRDFMFFFRREVVETLEWAGNPEKTYETGPLGDRLTPRRSFAIWKETVHRQSAPWTEENRQSGEAIRSVVVEVALRQSELVTDERSKADIRQRMLNEELNHRVKNILALIGALVAHPTDESQTLRDYVATLKGRIQALAHAHDQVVRGDGGGMLSALLNAELSPYRAASRAIDLGGPPVVLDAQAYSVMALVLHELATNAAKYGALSGAGGRLSVSWSLDPGGPCEILWQESGGPVVIPPKRRGFGTVLIDRAVPYDLGGTSEVEYRPGGVTGRFSIPAKHLSVSLAETAGLGAPEAAPAQAPGADLSAWTILIVEDQLVIAVGLEQILEHAKAGAVLTVGSESEALALLRKRQPDVAILDVNLGHGSSIGFAEELVRRDIPFLFATGYGDSSTIPTHLKHVRVVRKPYDSESILESLGDVMGAVPPREPGPHPAEG